MIFLKSNLNHNTQTPSLYNYVICSLQEFGAIAHYLTILQIERLRNFPEIFHNNAEVQVIFYSRKTDMRVTVRDGGEL